MTDEQEGIEFPEGIENVTQLVERYNELASSAPREPADPTPLPLPPAKAEDLEPFVKEYTEKGALSDESYEKIQKDFGVSRDIAESFVRGQEALAARQEQDLLSGAGVSGRDEWQKVTNWAQGSLSREEVNTFNETLLKGGEVAKQAAAGLAARYRESGQRPTEAGLSSGRRPVAVQPFSTRKEIQQAIGNPDYKSNKDGFRDLVTARMAVTDEKALRLHR